MNREFPIQTAVRFLWRDSDGALRMGVGVTHHISRSSVCIRAQDIPSLGARVQVIVDMPPASANTRRPGRLMGKGVAVRLEHAFGQPTAFAAQVRFRSKWACQLAPIGSQVPRREDAIISPTSQQEPLVRSTELERRETLFYDINVYKKHGHSR